MSQIRIPREYESVLIEDRNGKTFSTSITGPTNPNAPELRVQVLPVAGPAVDYRRLSEPHVAKDLWHGGRPIGFIPGGDTLFDPLPPGDDTAIRDMVIARRAEIDADARAHLATMRKQLAKVEAENREWEAKAQGYEAGRV